MAKETTRKSQPKPDDKEQSELFRRTARDRGADRGSGEAADKLLGKLAKMPPESRTKAKKRKGLA